MLLNDLHKAWEWHQRLTVFFANHGTHAPTMDELNTAMLAADNMGDYLERAWARSLEAERLDDVE